MGVVHTYPHDVGTSHVIEWHLWRELRTILANYRLSLDHWRNHPFRYADGEEERMELYR